jgi:hypothetical protein
VPQVPIVMKVESVEVAARQMRISYEVRNHGHQPIWLLDQIFKVTPSGFPQAEPSRAYVSIQKGRVVLSKQLHPIPELLAVESPEVPGVTPLPPGGRLTGQAVIPLPLRESMPYHYGPSASELPLSEAQEVRLRVGYLPDQPNLELHDGRDTQGQAFRYPSYAQAVKDQVLLDSGPLSVPAVQSRR